MYNIEKEVVLSVVLTGTQISRGSYTHFAKMDGDKLLQGVIIDKKPKFSEAVETVRLKEHFIEGAISEPPSNLSKMSLTTWNSIPQQKRIELHVKQYVRDMFPRHHGFTFEII